ncbi:hypothetical protein HMPREF0083_03240 [Aneurinibacillus aneurinilyticus ATCC 12856]|uniref:Sporulation protein YjcZ n=2 Tax=Aneurinibacillus aneurinilyticus TaxID=1391 RepID=U1X107_ANEAE|nr:hypothetical protein HMPREF0083_03240 [Aneurinibacillus aneurinilyticus ATCC 12856]
MLAPVIDENHNLSKYKERVKKMSCAGGWGENIGVILVLFILLVIIACACD